MLHFLKKGKSEAVEKVKMSGMIQILLLGDDFNLLL